jgi:hypothetical protein
MKQVTIVRQQLEAALRHQLLIKKLLKRRQNQTSQAQSTHKRFDVGDRHVGRVDGRGILMSAQKMMRNTARQRFQPS